RIALRKQAIPRAHSAVADVIKSSSNTTTHHTDSNSRFTWSVTVSDALSVAIQVIDCPIAIAVFGMARTTTLSSPNTCLISAQLTPEITETTICWVCNVSLISSKSLRSCCGKIANTTISASMT